MPFLLQVFLSFADRNFLVLFVQKIFNDLLHLFSTFGNQISKALINSFLRAKQITQAFWVFALKRIAAYILFESDAK